MKFYCWRMDQELPDDLGTRFGNLADLPEELKKQIPATRLDSLEQEILTVISGQLGGAATVDEVLVALFRHSGTVHERKKVAGKLYRMVSAKPPLLVAVPKKRGVYRIH